MLLSLEDNNLAVVEATPTTIALLGMIGGMGAIIMFIADLVLYYPTKQEHRSAASYFSTIDPGGNALGESSMQEISTTRVMIGGVMGPIASFFYTIGFLGLVPGLQDKSGSGSVMLPWVAMVGFSLFMTIAGVYHALFAYTCFISKEMTKNRDSAATKHALQRLLSTHQTYLRFVYKWCAISAIVGSVAFVWCCVTRSTIYHPAVISFTPLLSAPIKKLLKRRSVGGLVLCGGLTNLWNLCFFVALVFSAVSKSV